MNQNNNSSPGQRRPSNNNLLFIIVIFVLGPLFLFSYYDSKRIKESLSVPEEQYESTRRQEPQSPAPVNEPLSYGDTETPATRDDHPDLFGSKKINLSIGKDGFVPVGFLGSARWSPLNNQLTRDRSSSISKEPAYRGREQWYGYINLGNRKNNRFHFALDQQSDATWSLYFDKNNNGDLTDDGAPLRNQGSGAGGPGGFACTISIPWPVLIEDSWFTGDFNIWFFSNESGWEHGKRVSHYSRTQLQGKIRIGNYDYMALLIDQGDNDADLTNDGVALDLNRDGKIDRNETPQTVHKINGETYAFNVSW
jgi:hypothetical protein